MRKFDKLRLRFYNWGITKLEHLGQGLKAKRKLLENESVPFQFKSLAPYEDSDEKGVYCNALYSAFEQEGIFNIGLTGNYGSGKSSVLKTFVKKHQIDYKFLSISLATFTTDDTLHQGKNNKTSTQELELSILQQLLYVEKPKLLRYTRISRIRKIPKWQLVGFAILFAIWTHSCIFILKPGFLLDSYLWGVVSWKEYVDTIVSISWVVFGVGLVFILYRVFWAIRGARVSRFKIKEGELELNRETDHSIINRNLDEILYFFEETDYDTVLIEDLDRFQNEGIFAKLRELNGFLNNSAQVNRKIRFVYAVRDSLFSEAKNRTKFFDLIIPVVPVVNNTNSGDKLFEWLKDSGYENRIKKGFLLDISLYIDDMRLIKNIFNEFLIYEKTIGEDLIPDKLLGMIVYKNLYLTEFGLLHLGKGELNSIIEAKNNYTQAKIQRYESEIDAEHNKIAEDIDHLSQEESKTVATKVKAQIKILRDKIREEKSWSIGKIFRDEYQEFNDHSKIEIDKLVIYLIKNEYLDENFDNYISYFYTGIFTQKESDLRRAISSNQPMGYAIEIQNKKELISKIDISHFGRPAIFNFSILDFLLSNKTIYHAQIDAIMNQSKTNPNRFKEFLVQYFKLGTQQDELIQSLSKIWTSMWEFISNSNRIDLELKNVLCISFLTNCKEEIIVSQNTTRAVTKYLESKEDLLSFWPSESNDVLIRMATILKVKFKNLQGPILNEELLHDVFEKELFSLNYEMIEFMFVNELKIQNAPKKLREANFTAIWESESPTLRNYIEKNINEFTKAVYLKLIDDQKEDQSVIVEILNAEILKEELKISIVSKFSGYLANAMDLSSDKLTLKLYKEGKIEPVWDNVFKYYEWYEKLDSDLISFYKLSAEPLSSQSIPKWESDNEESVRQKICNDIIYCKELPLDVYEALLKSITYYYGHREYSMLTSQMTEALIKARRVRLSYRTYSEIQKYHGKVAFELFERAFSDEITKFLEEDYTWIRPNHLISIIQSQKIANNDKIRILLSRSITVFEDNVELSNESCSIFSKGDLSKVSLKLIRTLLGESDSVNIKLEFLLNVLKSKVMSKKQHLDLLKISRKPFSPVNIRGGGSFKIEMNSTTEDICAILKKREIISSYSKNAKANEIKVNRKKKHD